MKPRLFLKTVATWSISVAALAAAELPASVSEAMQVVRSVRSAVLAVPVLSGTESFDVDSFREALRASRGEAQYTRYLTARDVTDLVATGNTYASQLTYFEIGWAALDVNWVFATLLGDTEVADAIQAETNWLVANHPLYILNVAGQGGYGVFAAFFPRYEAANLAMLLRQNAATASLEAYIPDAIDPEGYVRQRLRGVFDRLTNSAQLIRDAGQAYSPYGY